MITRVGVVIPAHNEEALLERALRGVRVACDHAAPVDVHVVVVLDACIDASETIARKFKGIRSFEVCVVAARNVGLARAAGIERVLARFAGHSPAELWLATSDADSVVSPSWISDQLILANGGADAVTGIVEVDDWQGHHPDHSGVFREFYDAHGTAQHHAHVHGANLGARAAAYLEAGGFPNLKSGEDHALVNALRSCGRSVVSARHVIVQTSGRLQGRAPEGFADFLKKSNLRVA